MTRSEVYDRYFCYGFKAFWGPVMKSKDPKKIADAMRVGVMRIVPMIEAVASLEDAGYWASQFAILADDVQWSKNKAGVDKAIQRFRDCASGQKKYNRQPEDQSDVFNSEAWKNPRVEEK